MLHIREEQLEAFRQARTEDFVRRAAEYTRERVLTREVSPDEVRELVARARGYGFETETGIIGFIDLALHYGVDFDTNGTLPWAHDVLTSALSEQQKLAVIRQRTR